MDEWCWKIIRRSRNTSSNRILTLKLFILSKVRHRYDSNRIEGVSYRYRLIVWKGIISYVHFVHYQIRSGFRPCVEWSVCYGLSPPLPGFKRALCCKNLIAAFKSRIKERLYSRSKLLSRFKKLIVDSGINGREIGGSKQFRYGIL